MSDSEGSARKRLAEEALERARQATPGPWWGQSANSKEALIWKLGYEGAGAICRLDRASKYHRFRDNTSRDVDFIARSREDVPALAHALLEAEEERERLEEEVRDSRVLLAILLERLGGEPSISFREFDEMRFSGAEIVRTTSEDFDGYHYSVKRPEHE